MKNDNDRSVSTIQNRGRDSTLVLNLVRKTENDEFKCHSKKASLSQWVLIS